MSEDLRAAGHELRSAFQLVVTTVGRLPELERLLASIRSQTATGIHVVVVDQSGGDEVEALCSRYEPELTLTHVRSEAGASSGRNAGIRQIEARPDGHRIVAFPDDDCWYSPTLLADVGRLLQ
nr:glycosyltransferase family 2 protein [Actinomycetota bacterium]